MGASFSQKNTLEVIPIVLGSFHDWGQGPKPVLRVRILISANKARQFLHHHFDFADFTENGVTFLRPLQPEFIDPRGLAGTLDLRDQRAARYENILADMSITITGAYASSRCRVMRREECLQDTTLIGHTQVLHLPNDDALSVCRE
jgi:hypothetical protein